MTISSSRPMSRSGTIHVLHIDDDPDFADLAAEFLEREDERFVIETVTSAAEGLNSLRDRPPDCIVSDYNMPGMDGLDFLQAVREEYPDLPFILYTGKGSEEVASEAISLGVTDYLRKGSGTDQYELLANRITNAVSQVRAKQQLDEERQRFQVLFDRLSQATVEVKYEDDEPIVERVNPAFEESFGYDAAEIVGESLDAYIVPADRTAEAADINQRVKAGTSLDSEEVTRQTADGLRDFLLQNAAYDDGSGGFAIYTDITERKEREQKLERSRDLLRHVERLSRIGGWEVDPVTGDQWWTDGTYAIHDVSPESYDPSLEDSIEFYHPDDREKIEEAVRRCRETGEPYEVEARKITAEDRVRWIRVNGEAVTENGEIVALRGAIQDITEQKEREGELELFETMVETVPDGVYALDENFEYLGVNQGMADLLGYSKDELVGSHFSLVNDEAGIASARRSREQLVDADGEVDEEKIMTVDDALETADGEAVPCEVRFRALPPGEEGTFRGTAGVVRDMRERKAREARLEALNTTAQELMTASTRADVAAIGVEAARDILDLRVSGIHLYDDDKRGLVPVAQTEASKNLLGDPPTLTEGDSIAWRVFESGESLALDDVQDHPDVHDPDTSVRSELYLPIGEYGILITASETPEAFDREDIVLGEILAGTIATGLEQIERTEQLRTRERNLERQNERLDEFASVVSHDLRNPLTVAEGKLELAREECDSEYLDAVVNALDRMDTLIEDLLALAREDDRVSEVGIVDLEEFSEDCWRNVETADAGLRTAIDALIEADRSRLAQLLENLFRNAVEHGGEDVTVTIGEMNSGFYVEDDGPGIPEGERERVFAAGNSTIEAGIGFGLSIVQQVADAHGWEVRVTESESGGARFEITGVEFAA